MPAVIDAIIGILAILGASEAVAVALAPILLSLGVSMVLGEISKLFAKGPSGSSLTSQLASRTVTSRQPVAPRRVLYGKNRVGGIITFLHTTGANNEKLHIVISISGHEVNAITAMYFDGVAVPYDGSGNATGNFAGFAHVEFNLGTRGQASFPGLIAAAPAFWTSAHRQRGCAGAYVALTWDVNKFPNGVPNITFDVQGRKLYDPRTGTQVYSTNAALAIADYLTNAQFGLVGQTKYPLTAAMLTNSGMTGFTAAQCMDGDVTTAGFNTSSAVTGATLTIDLGAGVTGEFRRFRLYLSASLWLATLNIDYSDNNIAWTTAAAAFAPDIIGWNDVELAPNGGHRYWRIYLTNTPGAGAMTVNEIELYSSDVDSVQLIAAANTSDELVSLVAGGSENRFTINGSFDSSEAPAAVIGRMNSAMAGSVLYVAGLWGIFPGIWRAPTISLSDSDLRAAFTVQTRMPHRNLYNGVKGTYISPTNAWQISDYPPFQSAAYLQEDNNEPLWLDVELPFTTSGATAQRLSKIALRRARRQITVQAQFKLTAYQVQPLDVVQFSHPRFGWVNKTFEVAACSLVYGADSQNAIAVGVDLTLRESDSTVFDWTVADEIAINAPPTTTLPSNAVAQPP
ncbi:MAG TPA: phage tail protein, partial [Candidatus Dormibacteraeota bacterium]|nr:phage tail protein [Candidatus Dormibacteraeota bacterium]